MMSNGYKFQFCRFLAGTRSAPTQINVNVEQGDAEPESASLDAKSETKDSLSGEKPELIADIDGEKSLPGSRESPNKPEVEVA